MAAAATTKRTPRRRRRRPRTSTWRPPPARDPLRRARPGRWLRRLGIVGGTVLVHAIGLGGFALASVIFPEPPHEDLHQTERVVLRVLEPPPPVEAVVPEAPPVAPPPQSQPERPVRRAPPPPDPVDLPAEPAPQQSAPERRRIVGLSFESTVSGSGNGPTFATGNTRMGSTARRAEEPGKAPKLSPNRTATRMPSKSGTFTKPARVAPVEPTYPELLRARGIEADVVVFIRISADGTVTNAELIKGSEHSELNDAALTAARAQRFVPATRDGEPVPYSLKYTYRFRLDRT